MTPRPSLPVDLRPPRRATSSTDRRSSTIDADIDWVTARPQRHLGRRVTVLVLLVLLVVVALSLAQNPHMQWPVVWEYLFDGTVLKGIITTVELTVISLLLAVVLAVPLASMQQGESKVISALAGAYVWFFRGVPTIIQLLFWYNIALIVPTIHVKIPFLIEESFQTNTLITGFTASILGLGLHESAYMAEIVRAGINSVPKGQTLAAAALGMRRRQTLFRVILPQAARTILPPSGNEFIRLLKESSLVAIIGGGGLLTAAQYIYGQNYAVIPLLLVASIWYLVLTTVATIVQRVLESGADPKTSGPKAALATPTTGIEQP